MCAVYYLRSDLMLKNSEKSKKKPYYGKNILCGFWLSGTLNKWFTEYLTNTAMEVAFQKAEIECFRRSLRFF